MSDGKKPAIIAGKYQLVSKLGEGGMGQVFKAKTLDDTVDAEFVAIKVLKPELAKNSASLARFERESKIQIDLKHPNILECYESGKCPVTNYHFMVLEYLPHRSLNSKEVLDSYTIEDKLDIGLQIATALKYIHEKNLVHRDLKPENILLDEKNWVAKLSDFGISREEEDSKDEFNDKIVVTQEGMVVGSPAYMSPEQTLGKSKMITTYSDVFNWGATLYHLLTGQAPYSGMGLDAMQVFLKVSKGIPPKQIRQLDPSIPPELEEMVSWAMSRFQKDRPSIQNVISRLEEYLKVEDKEILQTNYYAASTKANDKYKHMRSIRRTSQSSSSSFVAFGIGAAIIAALGVGAYLMNKNGVEPINNGNTPAIVATNGQPSDDGSQKYMNLEESIMQESNALKAEFTPDKYTSLKNKIDTASSMLKYSKFEGVDKKKQALDEIKDNSLTLNQKFMYSALDKEIQGFESELKNAKEKPYSKTANDMLKQKYAQLGKSASGIDKSRVPDLAIALKTIEVFSQDLEELDARDPANKYASVEKSYSNAKALFESCKMHGDRRNFAEAQNSLKSAKSAVEQAGDNSSPEYKRAIQKIESLEQELSGQKPYLAELFLRFENEQDMSYFNAEGNVSVQQGTLNLADGAVAYNNDFKEGSIKFYASQGDFSVMLDSYDIKFSGNKVAVTKSGSIVSSSGFDSREQNMIKLSRGRTVDIYVNGQKLVSCDETPGTKIKIQGKGIKIDNFGHYD
jgi:serine/threonine protein kinase